ncbi:hypothetical protein XENTR_v10013696 [Xenopus tropicalis]|uniref:Probable tubulin polyglutamylase TTLL2 n=1 Tax=Xenopus tropicalis TaxID=8364 RepID=A0A6I8PMQ5_XENTR|nr:probable tubulin polyglutamylase TTLL2 [Xenopus tropicalis]XP_031758982.1 probable tubulin polyglutamylase TTLL2 [Xenopus tropicalis]XP_031758983.1 probable tubulin polyglutamylase TTLL2 [Xenopus tropicalis]KAE8601506.1 hypothetical protein XENTR_v10013696 [Xenopus tropicalis]KAE8601507.1 hypothetical protein XENTR_v10013696 [Xenopus tropicalis]KAE8601508.1 hypothetical protein XENTR_v10013696 [Xenopus tropicalis]KAE8601509.1 hypothetical protein XENTR_v10013696 [Xenopus tropicalis]|eukprot:XP_002942242.1 PREDICTED: probable tubulin polyglutamylase TTLL2 [Xenopus tropicalis]
MADGDEDDKTSSPLVFRLHDSTPQVVRDVLLERGWEEFDESDQAKTAWNLQWRSSAFCSSDHDSIKPWQRLNHHPRTSQMIKKDCLARHLKRMKGIYGPSYYEFSPVAFILPNEYTAFVAQYTKERRDKKSSYWICKPTDLSRGRGIFIFQDIKDLAYDCAVIVQKYITNPLLISGYKFDLRIYVCVTSFCPLTVYVYQEGLVRFATEKFDLSSLDNVFSHLTNTSINKYSASYNTEKERVGSGCKWTLGQFRSYLHGLDVDDVLLWQKIYNIVTMTLLAIAPYIPPTPNCFELFGFDILIDDTLKPWLLEVNYSPALSLDCSHDVTVKKNLIHDIIELLNFKTSDCQKDTRRCKKTNLIAQPLNLPAPRTFICDNGYMTNMPAKDNSSIEPFSIQLASSNNTSQNSPEMDRSNKSKGSDNEVAEMCYKKEVMPNGKPSAHPRKTLTSRLRERINISQKLPASKVISKTHSMLSPLSSKMDFNCMLQSSHQRPKYPLFPLYFISDLDKRPPSRVGDFLLVFPFNDSSFVFSTNGTDIKSIIQHIGRTMNRISQDPKLALN